jgi:hypothetical protein
VSKVDRDKPKIYVRRRGVTLVPHSEFDADMIQQYRLDAVIHATLEQPKSDKQERFVHGLIARVAKGIGQDPRVLRERLKWATLPWTSIVGLGGESIATVPSLADLGHEEYNLFVERVIDLVLTQILPDMKSPHLIREVERYIEDAGRQKWEHPPR